MCVCVCVCVCLFPLPSCLSILLLFCLHTNFLLVSPCESLKMINNWHSLRRCCFRLVIFARTDHSKNIVWASPFSSTAIFISVSNKLDKHHNNTFINQIQWAVRGRRYDSVENYSGYLNLLIKVQSGVPQPLFLSMPAFYPCLCLNNRSPLCDLLILYFFLLLPHPIFLYCFLKFILTIQTFTNPYLSLK